jgi:hypothetical protein
MNRSTKFLVLSGLLLHCRPVSRELGKRYAAEMLSILATPVDAMTRTSAVI